MNKHIVLIGDSIFDNQSYVNSGESVIELLKQKISFDDKATLLAIDGAITSSGSYTIK